ncbi:ABC transporter ATP-binding protein [Archangium lansingense]|uniref:ABC transporter ATP-binding protein n=1 Tax=Archangium lansingense TaxID=2995310 RepID=UPI003B7CFC56
METRASEPLVEVRGLTVRYAPGQPPILEGLDLTLRRGETVALMGPSGSGKSTLLVHLVGLRPPEGGEVHIQGRALSTLRPRELELLRAMTIGFVFQRAALLPFLTVQENLLLALEPLPEEARGTSRARLEPLLEAMQLGPLAHRRADVLSVGEAQRVAVARALIKQPPLVIADEPTGALDAANAAVVGELLLAPEENRSRAVLVATHDERVAARCDRVLKLQEGRCC